MHDKFFQIARLNMVKNQILPNNVKNKVLIESFSKIQKEFFVPKINMILLIQILKSIFLKIEI